MNLRDLIREVLRDPDRSSQLKMVRGVVRAHPPEPAGHDLFGPAYRALTDNEQASFLDLVAEAMGGPTAEGGI